MGIIRKHRWLLSVLVVTFLVYCFAHYNGIVSPYVINDDVRQQVYWMQKWQDPDLYKDHYLSSYAENYVPGGVRALYWGAAPFINPLQFSKVLTAILFTMTAGLLFVLASSLFDELAGVLTVCVYFHYAFFLGAISGGLSRGFVFPLLILYLIFLVKKKTLHAGIVVMIQSLFNPYLFVLCFFTHILFLSQKNISLPGIAAKTGFSSRGVQGSSEKSLMGQSNLFLQMIPVACGVIYLIAKYRFFQVPDFGSVVTLAEMSGQPEYTSVGRFEILPVPSLLYESIRPFLQDLPNGLFRVIAGIAGAVSIIFFVIAGWNSQAIFERIKRLKIFVFLLLASISLYFIARIVLLELFLPSRYLEYSLTVFYCIMTGILVRSAVDSKRSGKYYQLLIVILVVTGALRLNDIAIYDYGKLSPLYQFLKTTPKDCIIAGHPDVMDNVMTFSQRKVFLCYELSHPWYGKYWSRIKPWTYDFFTAYYSHDANEIRRFCHEHKVDYFVVRESDYEKRKTSGSSVYFEPFGSYISNLLADNAEFAALDETAFKILFRYQGIRVLSPLD